MHMEWIIIRFLHIWVYVHIYIHVHTCGVKYTYVHTYIYTYICVLVANKRVVKVTERLYLSIYVCMYAESSRCLRTSYAKEKLLLYLFIVYRLVEREVIYRESEVFCF